MTDFLLKSSVSLVVFLTFYHLVLEGEKMHRFNRFYLLATLVISIIIPFLSFEIIQVIPVQSPENNTIVPNFIDNNPSAVVAETNFIPTILAILYGAVTVVLIFRFAKNIYRLNLKKRYNPKVKYQNATLVLVNEKVLPHSFLNNIFVNYSEYQNQEIEDELFTHELVHVNQKHTLDILFIELVKILFWFNPLVYFYKKAIQLNHEFLADEKVVHSYNNVGYYQNLLLQKSSSIETIYLASNLNFLITKKRLIMMTKSTSRELALLKKATIVPVLTGLFYLFCIDVVAQEQTIAKTEFPHKELNEYYGNTRVIIKDKAGKVIADKKYPELTQEEKMKIPPPPPAPMQIKLSESTFDDFKNAAKYAIWVDEKSIKNADLNNYKASQFVFYRNSTIYENAKSDTFPQGNQVNLYTENGYKNSFYKKDKKFDGTIEITSSTIKMIGETQSSQDPIYNMSSLIDKPDFPGGIGEFYKFVGNTYKISEEINTNTKGGKVFVTFVIEKDGSLSNITVVRDFKFGTGEEAVRVLKLSPNWQPGKLKGKNVRVQYSLPIAINVAK
jgi:beta-lactamase regulating signal transducer with metallopeptidase domain